MSNPIPRIWQTSTAPPYSIVLFMIMAGVLTLFVSSGPKKDLLRSNWRGGAHSPPLILFSSGQT